MVVKMSSPGRSFGGVADYCLHDPRIVGEMAPESAERVEWTETLNLATEQGERAARIMAATAEASPDLKHLAGGAATGRKLEKPVCHYSLSWAKDERPDRQEMSRAAAESLKELGELERRSKREWSALYGRQERQREQLAKDCRGVLGRFRAWRELGGGVREIGGVVRGQTEVLGRFRAELEDRLRRERVSLGKEHSEAVRGIESKAGEFYRGGMEGSEKRARKAARSDGLLLSCYRRPDEFYRLKYSMLEERLEQVREIDGEQAYEKMRRAVEKASQEKASQEKARQVERAGQVERTRLEWARQVESRPERRGPERGGPDRDFGPSR